MQLFGVKNAILGVMCRFGGQRRAPGPIACRGTEPGAVLGHQSSAWGAGHVLEPGAVGLQLSAPGCKGRLLEGEGAGSTSERAASLKNRIK